MHDEPRFWPNFKRVRSRPKAMQHSSAGKYAAPKWAYKPQEITADELKALAKKMKSHLSALVQCDPSTTKTIWITEGEVAQRWGLLQSELRKLRDARKVTLFFQTHKGVHRCRLTDLRAFESKYKQ